MILSLWEAEWQKVSARGIKDLNLSSPSFLMPSCPSFCIDSCQGCADSLVTGSSQEGRCYELLLGRGHGTEGRADFLGDLIRSSGHAVLRVCLLDALCSSLYLLSKGRFWVIP